MVLSAAVYPGSGQFVQRRFVAGTVIAVFFTIALVYFVWASIHVLSESLAVFRDPTIEASAYWRALAHWLAGLLVTIAFYSMGIVDVVLAQRRKRADAAR